MRAGKWRVTLKLFLLAVAAAGKRTWDYENMWQRRYMASTNAIMVYATVVFVPTNGKSQCKKGVKEKISQYEQADEGDHRYDDRRH